MRLTLLGMIATAAAVILFFLIASHYLGSAIAGNDKR